MTLLDEVLAELRQLMQVDRINRYGDRPYYDVDYIRNHIFYLYRKAVRHVLSRYRGKFDRRRVHELNWLLVKAIQSMMNYPESKPFWDSKIEELVSEITVQ